MPEPTKFCLCVGSDRRDSGRMYLGLRACQTCGFLIDKVRSPSQIREDAESRRRADIRSKRKRRIGGLDPATGFNPSTKRHVLGSRYPAKGV